MSKCKKVKNPTQPFINIHIYSSYNFKKSDMKNSILFSVLVFLLISCTKNDNEISNPIIGEWKLIKSEQNDMSNNITVTDYSTQNIIYSFDSNSNLNINSGDNAGNYKYEFKKDYLSGVPSDGETKMFLVVINTIKWTYNQSDGKMQLGISYIDGPDLYFEKK